MSADNRASLLSLVRPQIDATLALAQEAMTKHVAQVAGNAALAACPLQFHQVYGALRIVRLEGATRYALELEAALRNAMRSGAADKAEIESISRAVTTLREFVADVAAGSANIPLRIFPAYRELARVSGNESATEKDLFFPDTKCETPAHAEPRDITPAVLPALLKELRSRYQRGLLGWLKESAKPDGLRQLRDVLDTLHKISARLPEPRGLWWASMVLIEAAIDALPDPQQADWIARVKPVCSRIDFLLRDLAAKPDADTTLVQRDVLYAIAVSRSSAGRVGEVRARFDLDSLLPMAQAAGANAASRLKPKLDDVQARLDNIKDTWTEYASAEPKRLERFREMLTPLTEKSRELGNAPLVQLLEAISAATADLPDPYPLDGQIMSLEMAAALLMAESIVQHFGALPDDLEQQVAIMRGWLTDATRGKAATTSPPGLRADIVQKVNEEKLRIATAREILKSLGQIEKTVEAFTRDRTRHDTLVPLASTLRQVSGVFQVSNQRRAARLATLCQRLIERCAIPAHPSLNQDIEWVAEGLSSLGFYLEPCQQGKIPAERAVNMFFTRYEQQAGNDAILTLTQSLPVAAPATPAAAPVVPALPPRDGLDREMLDVFLEEANEVLAVIEASEAQLRHRADDHDALLSVRRAFHTLKGSARMVGLSAFGECAWEMEQVMNHWRSQSLTATPELLTLARDARELLSEWAYALQGEAEPGIEAGGIAARAREMRGEHAAAEVLPVIEPTAPSNTVNAIPPDASATASEYLTVSMQPLADVAGPAETLTTPEAIAPHSPASQCDQALADLGDRLAWLTGLIEEIGTQTSTSAMANSRLREIADMMHESMAEASALHRSLAGHIAALKNKA
ncbi:MAG: Hpt domain-containing protein [Burkholderiales bacterium]